MYHLSFSLPLFLRACKVYVCDCRHWRMQTIG